MSVSKKIDFVIAGEPKSGTTALFQVLSQHPEICASNPKEPHYFATDHHRESDSFHGKPVFFYNRTPEDFGKMFAHAKNGERVFGEASTGYLYSREAAANIHKHNPKTKIIIMLREPVSFIHSLHMQYANETVESERDFAAALKLESLRKKDWSFVPKNVRCPSYLYYSERYKYAEQVKRFLDKFPKEQILVLTNEEFYMDSFGFYQKVLEYLEVEPNFKPDFSLTKNNQQARFIWFNRIIHHPSIKPKLQKLMQTKLYSYIQKPVNKILLRQQQRTPIPQNLKEKLHQKAAPEVDKISNLLDRDFTKVWGYDKANYK